MQAVQTASVNYTDLTHELGAAFASTAAQSDLDGTFVFENYKKLKEHRYFSLMVPEEFGGAGLSHSQMCDVIRIMAQYCASTALAFSMHQHLVAATVWKFIHKGEGVPLLQKVADKQLVLVSTGARDWLGSNGEMEKVDGGYRLSGRKHFASQSIAGDIAVTSAPYKCENGNWHVLHFAVPLKNNEGVSILNDWDVMGMRATGSQTIAFDNVFVPEEAIVLQRPRDKFHGVWDLVIGVAMPLIMSAYVGIAERSMDIALKIGRKYARNQQHLPYIIGKANNSKVSAVTQWKQMVSLTDDFRFTPQEDVTMEMLSLKTNVADAAIECTNLAMEAVGGQGFYRKNELERLFRDVHASQFHPLPKWDQYAFTGKRLVEAEA